MTAEIRALRPDDDREAFRSGDEALDVYFHRYAGQNQFRHHIGVTYVAVEKDRIVGFATVAAASLDADDLPTGRRMPPYPVPVLRVARLAVGAMDQRRGVGEVLLRYCIELAERLRDDVGCVGVVVDAKADAVAFYRRYGFVDMSELEAGSAEFPRPTLLFLPLGAVPPPR